MIVSRLTNDVEALDQLVTDGVTSLVQNTLLLFGTAIVLFFLDWRLALATLTVMPLMAAATAIFERLGLDYCCGGGQTLGQACRAAGVSAEEVEASIENAAEAARSRASQRNWTAEPLADLMAHVLSTHHAYTRAAIERLHPLFDKVCGVHGKNHADRQR